MQDGAEDRPRRPKLLFVAADFPLPVASGSQARQLHLLRSFARHFEVTLVSPTTENAELASIPELERHAARVVAVRPDNKRGPLRRLFFKVLYWLRRYSIGDSKDRYYNAMPSLTRAIRRELEARPDVLFTVYWYWDARIWQTSALKVIDANDVQWHRVARLLERTRQPLERLLRHRLLRRYVRMESEALRRADLVVAITERDRREFDDMTGGAVEQIVIPTGLDTDAFHPEGDPRPDHIGFFGSLRNPMNRDAVQYLVEDIWPELTARHPTLTLSLIGAGATPGQRALVERHANIEMTGYVEDIRGPLRACQAVLLPLRIGWGIRGRVFEVMALGVPVVATPVAVDGMGLEEGEGILMAQTPAEFTDIVARLLIDAPWRLEVGERGRRVAVQKASIGATYDRLAAFLRDRVAAGAGRDGAAPRPDRPA